MKDPVSIPSTIALDGLVIGSVLTGIYLLDQSSVLGFTFLLGAILSLLFCAVMSLKELGALKFHPALYLNLISLLFAGGIIFHIINLLS